MKLACAPSASLRTARKADDSLVGLKIRCRHPRALVDHVGWSILGNAWRVAFAGSAERIQPPSLPSSPS
eukprot:6207700-Pleurochrysis_carterae.AAC.6